jgi:fibronectin-binding autotransporter adhesin
VTQGVSADDKHSHVFAKRDHARRDLSYQDSSPYAFDSSNIGATNIGLLGASSTTSNSYTGHDRGSTSSPGADNFNPPVIGAAMPRISTASTSNPDGKTIRASTDEQAFPAATLTPTPDFESAIPQALEASALTPTVTPQVDAAMPQISTASSSPIGGETIFASHVNNAAPATAPTVTPQVASASANALAAPAVTPSVTPQDSGVEQYQYVTNNFDFHGSGDNVAGAPPLSFHLPSYLHFSNSNSKSFSVVGVPVSLSYSVSGGLKGTLTGSLGTYDYDYPVTIGVTMARDVTDSAVFYVDPELISVDDATFSMTGPSATATLSLGFGFKAGISVGTDGSLLKAGPSYFTGISLPSGKTFEIPDIPGASVTVEDPTAFTVDDSVSASDGSLPSLTASGSGNNFISASLDLIGLAVGLLSKPFPPIKLIDQSINFDIGSLSYAIASLPLQAGLKLAQSVTLKPMGITEALTEFVNGVQVGQTQTKPLGTAIPFTAPANGAGEIDIDAVYTAEFGIETNTGVAGDISLTINGPHATGTIFGIGFSIGPLGSYQFFNYSTGLGAIGGTATTSVFSNADSTVYTLFYGYGYTVNPNTSLFINGTGAAFSGGILALDDSVVDFGGTAPDLNNDIIVAQDATIEYSDNQQPLLYSGNIENENSTSVFLHIDGGGAIDFYGQIEITGFVDIVDSQVTFENAISTPSGIIVEGGTALYFNADASLGLLSGSGTVGTVGGSVTRTLTIGTGNANSVFSGRFEGGGTLNLTKVGTGVFTLLSAATPNGATTVSNGTLQLSVNDTSLREVEVDSPGILGYSANLDIGSLSGSGTVEADNTGLFLDIGDNDDSTTFSGHLTATSTVDFYKYGAGTLTLTGANTYGGKTTVVDGTLQIRSTSFNTVIGKIVTSGIVIEAGAILDYEVADKVNHGYVISAPISGAGSLEFTGQIPTGITDVDDDNSFSGGTLIANGIVNVPKFDSLGSGRVTMTGGAIRAIGGTVTLGNDFTLSGTIGTGANTDISGDITLAGDTFVSPSINAGGDVWSGAVDLDGHTLSTIDTGPSEEGGSWSGKSLTISGVISGDGGIAQNSIGTLILSATNTYTGPTTIVTGTLEVLNASDDSAVGTLGTGAVNFQREQTLAFNNHDTVNDGYIITNQINYYGQLLFEGTDDSVTTVDMDDSTSFYGFTTIQSGIVNVLDSGSFGTGTIVMTGGALRATEFPAYVSNAFSMSGTLGFGASTNLTGAITLTGNLTVTPSENAGDSVWSGAVNLDDWLLLVSDVGPNTDGATWADEALTISGAISGAGGITQGGSGDLILTGANSYTGGTTLESGSLTIGSATAIGTGALGINSATVNLTASATVANNITLSGDDTFNLASGDSVTLSGNISDANSDVQGEIIVAGGGRMVLSGDDTFSGGIIVESGNTLELASPSAGGTGPITVQNGAALQIDAGDGQHVSELLDFGSTATLYIRGVVANSAFTNGGSLILDENGAYAYSIHSDSLDGETFDTFPIYNGAKVVGAEVTLVPQDPTTVLGFQENINYYLGTAGHVGIADTAANIAGNLAYLEQYGGYLTSITASDTLVGVSATTFGSNQSFLDRIAGGFVVSDTAPNVIAALSAINADSHASIAMTSGSGTLATGAPVTAPNFSVSGSSTTLTVAEALTYGGAFSETAGATISISSGDSLTLRGASTIAAKVSGAGGLSVSGNATITGVAQISVGRLAVAGKGTVVNFSGNASYGGTFVVNAGASANIATAGTLGLSGTSNISGAITGGKLLLSGGATAMLSGATISTATWTLSGSGVTTISENLSYGGTFTAAATPTLGVASGDSFTLTGVATFNGLVKGVGSLDLSGATTTVAGGAVLNVANWFIAGGTTVIGKNLAYAGTFAAGTGAVLTLSGSSAALTLQAHALFAGATINGAGVLTTAGASGSTAVSGLTIGGAVDWTNIRTITENGGSLTLGAAIGDTATLINAKAGVYDMTDDNGIKLGGSLGASIANAGIIEKTGGGGDSLVQPNIKNTGLMKVTAGELELGGKISGTGTLQVLGGATLQVDGGVASTQTLTYGSGGGEIALADLNVGGTDQFSGFIHGWASGDSLNVGTSFGAGTLYSFLENKGHTGGTLTVTDNGLSAAINFNGLGGAVVSAANFTQGVDPSGATLFSFHS